MSSTSETPINKNSMDRIQYKGWNISKETDPWAISQGWNFFYFQDERVRGAATIEEAKSEIDERIAEQESKNPNPTAGEIRKLEIKIMALEVAIAEFLLVKPEYSGTSYTLIQIRDDFKQQLNDLQIDANTLPFPEK